VTDGQTVFLVNPASANGATAKRWPALERQARDFGLEPEVAHSTGPGGLAELARQAADDGAALAVAVGGDGTVHEVVNGMVKDGGPVAADAVLGVVAAGSGSDFVRSFGPPDDAAQAAARLAGDKVRTIDVGTVTCADGETRCFVNIAEVGLGAAVVAKAANLGRFLGGARYAAGFWLTLPRFRPATVRLDASGQYHAWRAFNVVVANCRFYGGGMQISPNSDPGDCLLDILVMTGPKSDSFTTLPKVYKGAHLPHRNIAELRAAQLSIEAEPDLPVEADGEVLGVTPASFGIIPGAIRLKV